MNRTFWMAAAAACGLAAAGSAQATTYNFVEDACSGGCGASPATPVGTVVTTLESPGVINVLVTLTNGGAFHDTNNKEQHALVFDLTGSPNISVSGLVAPFTANGAQAPSSVSASGFGTFEYFIEFPKETHPPDETSFSFDVSSTSGPALGLDSFVSNGRAFFATDIWAGPGESGHTGNVGALPAGNGRSVPEPATWAMMIAGMGLVGTTLRRRRTLIAI